jgi:NAD+ kinase
MKRFKNIGLYTNSLDSEKIFIARQIEEILGSKGCKVLYGNAFKKPNKKLKIRTYADKYLSSNCDLVIAIGGDGTMLSCSRLFGIEEIPVLGINLGSLGFLTDIAPDELTTKLLEVINGKYTLDKRFFLETQIKNSQKKHIALNEVVIHSGAIAQLIEYDLFIDDVFVFRQKADGLIISSPTGSTAYSLSGGGPIVHPSLDAISIVPMFPHSLSSSPLVVNAQSQIKIVTFGKKKKANLSFDSHNSLLLPGENEINISKSSSMLNLLHPVDHDFYDGCRNKLGWSSGIVTTDMN